MSRIGDLQSLFSGTVKGATSPVVTRGNPLQVADDPNTGNAAVSTSLSSTSGTLLAALGKSDVRAEKVAALQKSISSGTYRIAAGDVAESVVKSMLGSQTLASRTGGKQ